MDRIEKELIEQMKKEGYAFDMESAFEMANVSKDDTGLPYDLWIDSIGSDRNTPHSLPRLKVRIDGKFIPVLLSDNPDIPDSVKKAGVKDFPHFSEIKKYIKAYLDVLLAHYNKELTDKQALNILSTIDEAKEVVTNFNKNKKS